MTTSADTVTNCSWGDKLSILRLDAFITLQGKLIAGGTPASDHIIMTIEGYFNYMKESLAAGRVTSLLFDPADGHPLFFSRDWHLTQFDGLGERFWFSGFRKLGGR